MNLFCLRLAVLLGLLVPSAAWAQDTAPAPIVYTGYLHHQSLDQDQLVRIFFQKSMKVGGTAPYLSAEVLLYFGASGGTEYVDFYYEPLGHNPTTREFLLQRDDFSSGRRLPTIKMTYDPSGATLTGTLTSMTEGPIGTLSLANGWNPPEKSSPKNLIEPLAGIYDAGCEAGDGSAMSVQDIELVSSRIFTDHVSPEGAFNVINYMGSGNCDHGGLVNCVSFTSGTYNFFRNTVRLMQGGWAWDCTRDSSETLQCTSPRYPQCSLTRRSRTAMPTEGKSVSTPFRAVTTDIVATQLPASQTCEAWQGEFVGTLEHALSHKTQTVRLNFTTFLSQGPSPSPHCQLVGSAQILFAEGAAHTDMITHPIPQTDLDASRTDQVIYSDNYTDLVVDVHQSEDGILHGAWYSKIFGYVGDFTAQRNAALPTSTPASVAGLQGRYVISTDTTRKLALSSAEAGFDRASHDPFVQIGTVGTISKDVVIDGRVMSWPDSVNCASYDYFTGYLVLRSSNALYYGTVAPPSLALTGMPRSYMAISHPFGYQYVFRRTQ